jgi:hypothetical protein
MRRSEDRDALGDQLLKVLVRRNDDDLRPIGFGGTRERANDVVGLDARADDHRDVQRLDDLLDVREVVAQIVRHGLAMRLVGIVQVIAKRAFAILGIEDDGHVIHAVILDELDQGIGEAVGGGRVLPLRIDQRAADEDEMRAIGKRHRVDEVQSPACIGRIRVWHVLSLRGTAMTGASKSEGIRIRTATFRKVDSLGSAPSQNRRRMPSLHH